MLKRKRSMPRIFCVEKRPRQDSNLQPRDLLTFHMLDTLAGALAHVGEGAAA